MSLTTRIDGLERNLIINGNMDYFQRGISFTGLQAAGNTYCADRFAYRPLGASVTSQGTLAQSTDVPTQAQSGWQSRYSTIFTVTTPQASFTGTSGVTIGYVVEGHDLQAVWGKKCRFQFWVKISLAGTYSVAFENANSTRCYTTTYTISAAQAGTWQLVAIDLQMDNAGTWNFDNNAGMFIYWSLAMGATRQTGNLNQWNSTDTPAASTQTNFMATNGATFQLAQVMLIPNDFTAGGASNIVIPFHRHANHISGELVACMRYCEINAGAGAGAYFYNATQTALGGTQNIDMYWNGFNNSGTLIPLAWKVEKRIAPTNQQSAQFFAPYYRVASTTGVLDRVRDNSAVQDRTVSYTGNGAIAGTHGAALYANDAALTSGAYIQVYWICDTDF